MIETGFYEKYAWAVKACAVSVLIIIAGQSFIIFALPHFVTQALLKDYGFLISAYTTVLAVIGFYIVARSD